MGVLNEAGSHSADADFEALYREHHRAILGYCARRVSHSDAWDATSEVFMVAWRRFEEVPSRHVRAWLMGVAHRVLSNQRRAAQRARRLHLRVKPHELEGTAADEPLLRGEEETQVLAALSRLRALDRELLQLSIWEELPAVAIAVALDISRDAVDQRLSRAKRRLAKEFERPPTVRETTSRLQKQDGGVT